MEDKRTFVYKNFDISYEETQKGWSMPYSHHHTHYEIYVLLSGERIVTIGDITHRVEAGFACLFESNISHRSVGETDYSGICIHFSKSYLEKYFLPEVVASYLTCFKTPLIFIPKDYQEKLLAWNESMSRNSPSSYLLLAQLLIDLSRFRKIHQKKTGILVSENKASGPLRIINYIDSNYTMVQSVSDIAVSCGVSESYIHRVVKQTTSLTVKKYINRLRLRHAIHEIECTNNSFAIISKSCGFQSVSYFYRVFKNYYGRTPTQYREHIKRLPAYVFSHSIDSGIKNT